MSCVYGLGTTVKGGRNSKNVTLRNSAANVEEWEGLFTIARKGNVTLLYGAKDTENNDAIALMQFLKAKIQSPL